MSRCRAAGLLLLALAACGDKDGDTAEASAERPDPTGSYNVVVLGTAGCEGDPSWVNDWAAGPLQVTASGADVRLDFGQNVVLDGVLEANGDIRVGGGHDQAGAALETAGTGRFVEAMDGWSLSGTLSAVVDDGASEPCTVDAPFEATELVGDDG